MVAAILLKEKKSLVLFLTRSNFKYCTIGKSFFFKFQGFKIKSYIIKMIK